MLKIAVVDNPIVALSQGTSANNSNNSMNLMSPGTRVFAADSVGLSSFISFFCGGTVERLIFSAIECVSAVQGHPRSLILAPIERAYATPY